MTKRFTERYDLKWRKYLLQLERFMQRAFVVLFFKDAYLIGQIIIKSVPNIYCM